MSYKHIAIGLATLALVVSGVALFSKAGGSFGGQFTELNHKTFAKGFVSKAASTFEAAITATSATFSGAVSTGELTEGGGVYATTTTVATETITGEVLEDYNVIRFLGSATAAAMTATIQATSSWPSTLLPNAGDMRRWVIENGYTAAATTTTIAAGAGIDLQEPDGQDVVIGINNYAWLTCYREASTDVVCLVDESIPAD